MKHLIAIQEWDKHIAHKHVFIKDDIIIATVTVNVFEDNPVTIGRIMVTMPPRHGKSELCSKYFPAWYLGTHPNDRIILTSYEADFAATWGQKVRDIFKEHKTVFGVNVNDRSAARNRWDIAGHRGGMGTAGVGGPITGKGAEILIIAIQIIYNIF